MNCELTVSERWAALGSASPAVNRPMARILAEVSAETGFTPGELKGPSRVRPLVHARHYAMWRCYRETDNSQPAVGRFFNRDHTSVIHALRQVERRISNGKPEGAKP